jgi:carbon-monoxide dehydrogenase large subunit
MRSNIFPEIALVLWAAKKTGHPVKWTGDRSEAFLCDDQGRDMLLEVTLALSKDGEFQALHLNNVANMGAYLSVFGPFPAFGNMGGLAGVYRTPAISADITGVITNTAPVGPYRGAGRPEAIMAIECAIDQAAMELGIDRIDLRRRNMIASDQMPYQTGHSYMYDCGRFEENLDKVLARADVEGFAGRRQSSAAKGRLRGLGVVNAIEQSAGLFDEGAEIRFDANGHATLFMGTHSHGQGHETVFRQIIAERLGLDFERIHFVQGDTDTVSHGHGTFGSRSLGLGGSAIHKTADAIIKMGIAIAAHVFETAEQDIEFSPGHFAVSGTDKKLSLEEISRIAMDPSARPAEMAAGLRAFTTFTPVGPTFPNASHVCEVEIDPETGRVSIERYAVVCDVGTVINPLLLEGQVHGGVAQGLGQILLEEMVWDTATSQPITGSFMDYAMPRADNIPPIKVATNEVPTAKNPLGAKGAGESGTVGAMPCLHNAIADALTTVGAKMVSMPVSPEKIWRAIAGTR